MASSSATSSKQPPAAPIPPVTLVPAAEPGRVKLALVDFRSGEAVERHPDLAAYLAQGATIKSAEPRISEVGTPKLLVVLTLPAS